MTFAIESTGPEGDELFKTLCSKLCDDSGDYTVTAASNDNVKGLSPFKALEILDQVESGDISDIYELHGVIAGETHE